VAAAARPRARGRDVDTFIFSDDGGAALRQKLVMKKLEIEIDVDRLKSDRRASLS
jgi:hypothetical protein